MLHAVCCCPPYTVLKLASLTGPWPTRPAQYVSEVVGALCEAPLRLKDVPAALAVCSALHQRYPDFAKELVQTLARLVASPGARARRRLAVGYAPRLELQGLQR